MRQHKGITLIALVITIIIMLILAGVSIGLVFNGGLINYAKRAKTSQETAGEDEILESTRASARIDILSGNLDKEGFVAKLKGTGFTVSPDPITNETERISVTGKNGKVTIIDLTTGEKTDGITLSKAKVILLAGGTEIITATVTEGIEGNITWESAHTNIATVTNGTITIPVGATGETTITATIEGTEYAATCRIIVVARLTGLTIENETVTVGKTKQLTATKTPTGETEEVEYTSSNPDIATVDNEGRVRGIAEGETTITVKVKGRATPSATCTVTVEEEKLIGDYVNYGVTYTDMYTEYPFTTTNGWRILSVKPNETNPNKKDINIISTGIPANLYYHYNTNNGNENNGWWGTKLQVSDAYGATIANRGYIYNSDASISGYPNYYAATGLRMNFASIQFSQGTSATANLGCYTEINEKTTGELTGAEFLVDGFDEISVHNLTLEELNLTLEKLNIGLISNDTTGLLHIRKLAGNYNYTASTRAYYWLGAPGPSGAHYLYLVNFYGSFSNTYDNTFGVRPVVSISNVSLTEDNNGIWQIGD